MQNGKKHSGIPRILFDSLADFTKYFMSGKNRSLTGIAELI
jgi:hypothetical protein